MRFNPVRSPAVGAELHDMLPQQRNSACAAVALAVMFALWVELTLGGKHTTIYMDDLATLGAAAIAAVSCGVAARGQAGRLRLFWSLLAAGCAAWTLGELLWAYYDLELGHVPDVSWADAAYLAALPLVGAALLLHPAANAHLTKMTRSVLDSLVIATSLFLLTWTIVLEPIRHTVDLGSLAGVVTLAYPLSDVVIVFLVCLVLRGTTRRGRYDLTCLLLGLLAISCSDSVYTYLTDVRNYATGGLIDTGWFAGYLAIALGALASRGAAPVPARERRAPNAAALLAPLAPMLIALCFLAVRLELGHPLDHVAVVVAFVLVGLVVVRQLFLIVDLIRTHHEHGEPIGERIAVVLAGTPDPPSTLRDV